MRINGSAFVLSSMRLHADRDLVCVAHGAECRRYVPRAWAAAALRRDHLDHAARCGVARQAVSFTMPVVWPPASMSCASWAVAVCNADSIVATSALRLMATPFAAPVGSSLASARWRAIASCVFASCSRSASIRAFICWSAGLSLLALLDAVPVGEPSGVVDELVLAGAWVVDGESASVDLDEVPACRG